MNKWSWIFCGLCLLGAAGVILWNRWNTKKTMDTLDQMLSEAMNGTFSEKNFDESRLSALETRLAHYLSASAISARNISAEKDRIKTLIGDISHQTKTPIANLLLYTELLEEEPLSAQAGDYVQTLHGQTVKLQFLIDALVKLSRLENGMIALKPAKGPLTPMLEQVQRQFASKAEKKGLTLCLTPTNAAACYDPKWTGEALCNLLDNAIKYTDHGGVTVSVTPYELFVRIDVEDTGVGIPEEEHTKIFSRFYRADQHAEQEGVGIGLYLTRQILRSEGGYIKVSSQPGKGSVFSVFLPA